MVDFDKTGFASAANYKRIRKKCSCLSTGIFPIDFTLSEVDDEGFAGIRERDLLELSGPNNSFKTAAAISMIRTTQKRFPGDSVIAIFSESFDPDRLERCGVDLDRLKAYTTYDDDGLPDMVEAESALGATLKIVRDPEVRLVVIDSVAALTPRSFEFDGSGKKEREFGKASIALLARLMNEFTLKFKNHSNKAVLCMVNHYKEKIDTEYNIINMGDRSKLQTPGGRGSEFLSDVRILCSTTPIMEKNPHEILGIRQGSDRVSCKWIMYKNKYCPAKSWLACTGEFDTHKNDFNNTEVLLNWGKFFTTKNSSGVYQSKLCVPIIQAGTWYRVGDYKAQGLARMAAELDEKDPDLVDRLKKEMYHLHYDFYREEQPTLDELLEN